MEGTRMGEASATQVAQPTGEAGARQQARSMVYWWAFTTPEKFLVLFFLLMLPLVNPCVHGDGVGYYAYVRSLLIHHNLRFEQEWLAGNPTFVSGQVDRNGHLRADRY